MTSQAATLVGARNLLLFGTSVKKKNLFWFKFKNRKAYRERKEGKKKNNKKGGKGCAFIGVLVTYQKRRWFSKKTKKSEKFKIFFKIF